MMTGVKLTCSGPTRMCGHPKCGSRGCVSLGGVHPIFRAIIMSSEKFNSEHCCVFHGSELGNSLSLNSNLQLNAISKGKVTPEVRL